MPNYKKILIPTKPDQIFHRHFRGPLIRLPADKVDCKESSGGCRQLEAAELPEVPADDANANPA